KGSNSIGCSSISAGSTSSSSASDGAAATDCTSVSLNGTVEPGRSVLSPGLSGVFTLVDLRGLVLECAALGRHPDVPFPRILIHSDQPQLHHLQQCQEGDHHLAAGALAFEQLDEGDPLAWGQPCGDGLHRGGQGELVPDDLVAHAGLEGLQ